MAKPRRLNRDIDTVHLRRDAHELARLAMVQVAREQLCVPGCAWCAAHPDEGHPAPACHGCAECASVARELGEPVMCGECGRWHSPA